MDEPKPDSEHAEEDDYPKESKQGEPQDSEEAVDSKSKSESSDSDDSETTSAPKTPSNQVIPQLMMTDGDQPAKPVVMKAFNWLKVKKYVLALLFLAIVGVLWFYFGIESKPSAVVTKPKTQAITQAATASTANAQGLQLDTTKNYGNKYANGILPVGDGKYSTTSAKAGTVYACSQYAKNLGTDQGGAQTRGPWFTNNNTQYDLNKKVHVNGSVMWTASFSNKVSGSTRTIVTNDLPTHPTGIYPIASTDPAYAYDRNPNSIKGQTLTFTLSANPTYNAMPNCMGGQSGVMLTGVAIFNGFDAGGRDAGAWEVQDSCSGHPESQGEYHYHTLSSCIKDINVKTVIGYALDGFPITGPQVTPSSILTTSDLDECHGITSQITVDGKTVTSYHYVMTQDFPYSVSCFRSKASDPPGLQGAGQQSGANQQQSNPTQPPPPKPAQGT